jgi:hypothetical protein
MDRSKLSCSDLILAAQCEQLACNNGIYVSDMAEIACLAHLADARVWPCGVIYGKAHIKGESLIGCCQDWGPVKKEAQRDGEVC